MDRRLVHALQIDPRAAFSAIAEVLGVSDRTMLSVAPVHLEQTGTALAEHPEVAFAGATTGPTNLFATVVCPDQRELYRYLTTRLAALPAITHAETATVIRTLKRAAHR
ncbi:hypothetical protein ALI144C_35595 [Actinosynnema sp. ALI-1.44]|nr:hypothetical protein ALI144C_35595 [Actinosynnema sp. ALI-1.44]